MKRSIGASLIVVLAAAGCSGSSAVLPSGGSGQAAAPAATRRLALAVYSARARTVTLTLHGDGPPTTLRLRAGAASTHAALDVAADVASVDVGGVEGLPVGKGELRLQFAAAAPKGIVVVPSAQNQNLTGDQTGGFDIVGARKADGATSYPRTFTAVAVDGTGAFIVGTGAPKMAMTSLTAGVISNGVAGSNPNKFSVTPVGVGGFPETGSMKVTATPKTGAAIALTVTMRVPYPTAPRVYALFPTENRIGVYDLAGNPVSLASAFSSLHDPIGFCFDAHNDSIYVVNGVPSQLIRFTPDGANLKTVSIASATEMPTYDAGTGYIYAPVFNAPFGIYNENLDAISTIAGTWKETPNNAYPLFSAGTVGDVRNGQIYMMDGSTHIVQIYDTSGNGITDWAPQVRGSSLYSMVQDPSTGLLYVSDQASTVQVFDESGTTQAVSGKWSYLKQAGALAFDTTNRRLYVYDVQTNVVRAYSTQGILIATPGGFPGIANAQALMVVP